MAERTALRVVARRARKILVMACLRLFLEGVVAQSGRSG
jgi:hypothetical protein